MPLKRPPASDIHCFYPTIKNLDGRLYLRTDEIVDILCARTFKEPMHAGENVTKTRKFVLFLISNYVITHHTKNSQTMYDIEDFKDAYLQLKIEAEREIPIIHHIIHALKKQKDYSINDLVTIGHDLLADTGSNLRHLIENFIQTNAISSSGTKREPVHRSSTYDAHTVVITVNLYKGASFIQSLQGKPQRWRPFLVHLDDQDLWTTREAATFLIKNTNLNRKPHEDENQAIARLRTSISSAITTAKLAQDGTKGKYKAYSGDTLKTLIR